MTLPKQDQERLQSLDSESESIMSLTHPDGERTSGTFGRKLGSLNQTSNPFEFRLPSVTPGMMTSPMGATSRAAGLASVSATPPHMMFPTARNAPTPKKLTLMPHLARRFNADPRSTTYSTTTRMSKPQRQLQKLFANLERTQNADMTFQSSDPFVTVTDHRTPMETPARTRKIMTN